MELRTQQLIESIIHNVDMMEKAVDGIPEESVSPKEYKELYRAAELLNDAQAALYNALEA